MTSIEGYLQVGNSSCPVTNIFFFVLFQHMDINTAYLLRKISCFAFEVMGMCFIRLYITSRLTQIKLVFMQIFLKALIV